MSTITLLTAVFCLLIGAAVLWANPRRFANQIFLGTSLLITLWLLAVFMAMRAHEKILRGDFVDPTPWIRTAGTIAAFIPSALAALREALLDAKKVAVALRTMWPWLLFGCFVAGLAFTESFVVENSAAYRRSSSYSTHVLALALALVVLLLQSWRQMRAQTGITRLELQFLTFSLGLVGLLLIILNTAGNWLQIRALNRASIPVIFAAYGFIAWAITHHRIFDARQVFLGLAQRAALVAVLCGGIIGVWRLSEEFLPSSAALVVALGLVCSVAFWLDRRTREWLRLDGEELLSEWRAAVLATARTETHPDRLVTKFADLMRTLCQSSFAALLFARKGTYIAGEIALPRDHPGFATLAESGWATPENLQRRRPNPGLDDLRLFFHRHALGLVVTASRGNQNPSFLLALGVKTTRWPFTYPEVRRVQAIAELMDNILSHARLTAQAALEARLAHLALMSRGLAHDLKNLLTPISSFLVHTDGRFAASSAEAEVHAAARRSVRLMNDYVREALFFSTQLQPRFEPIDFANLFAGIREVAAPLAAQRDVVLAIPSTAALPLTADIVLLQRMLGNLVRNALEACSAGGHVALTCAAVGADAVQFQVSDNGCGIAPEQRSRIFEPYFTTKEFGHDVRGFGLGLAICEKISALHHGTITVQSEPGRGTTVTVELPVAPPPSALETGSAAADHVAGA